MEHWPHCKCHLQIYRCKADRHHHLILGPDNVSWPFWSLDAGLKHVVFAKEGLMDDARSPEEERWVLEETSRVQKEVQRLPLRRHFLYHEGPIADAWAKFFTGKASYIYYEEECEGGTLQPLHCDFVERKEQKLWTAHMPLPQQVRLAFAPAKPVTMEELGIKLEIIK